MLSYVWHTLSFKQMDQLKSQVCFKQTTMIHTYYYKQSTILGSISNELGSQFLKW